MDTLLPYLGLSALIDDVGHRTIQQLVRAMGSADAVWRADQRALAAYGCTSTIIERFLAKRASIDFNAMLAAIEREGLTVIPRDDERYPPLLRPIADPPLALFVRGDASLLATRGIAVVGTRKCTAYGRAATRELVGPLSRAGLTIVSGLAYGIDAEAHRACLDAGGRTVAVLGTGVDAASVYPSGNRALSTEILERGGCVVSEYVPGTAGIPMHFPARNRIVAAITLGVIAVEAPEDSGALITTRFSLDFGREVFVVPGPITSPMSAGTNALLKVGATPVTSAADIIDALHLEELLPPAPKRTPPAGGLAGRVCRTLSATPTHIDDLRTQLNVPTPELAHTLTSLELDGAVRDVGGSRYVRIS